MPAPRRVLIVAYYFPPMGMSGVQRVAKFAKYLPEYGWQPTVLTVEPAGYFAYDASLLGEIERAGVAMIRTPSLDPTRLFGTTRTVALPAESTRRRLAAVSQFLFIPDNKIGWYPSAVRAGRRELQARRYDAVFASAPPYTALLIAERLSKAGRLPLVVDFRDDWLENPRHRYPSPLHRAVHRRMERRVVGRANSVIAINETIKEALHRRHPGGQRRFHVLPQGYDPDDFAPDRGVDPSRLRIVYCGVFYDVQTPDTFLHGLRAFLGRHPEATGRIEAVFVGLVPEASERLIASLGLEGVVTLEGYLPHRDAVGWLGKADVLWMTVGRRPGAEGISTGKLFEYMGAAKPILALVPEGEVRTTLDPYGAAFIVDPDDAEEAGRRLEDLWNLWKAGRLPEPDPDYIARFDRRSLAQRLAGLLDEAYADVARGGEP